MVLLRGPKSVYFKCMSGTTLNGLLVRYLSWYNRPHFSYGASLFRGALLVSLAWQESVQLNEHCPAYCTSTSLTSASLMRRLLEKEGISWI